MKEGNGVSATPTGPAPYGLSRSASQAEPLVPDVGAIEKIKSRKYECFMEDHEPLSWTPGQCAGYAGRGSLLLHLFRCKRKSGHGLGGLFCHTHAKTGGF